MKPSPSEIVAAFAALSDAERGELARHEVIEDGSVWAGTDGHSGQPISARVPLGWWDARALADKALEQAGHAGWVRGCLAIERALGITGCPAPGSVSEDDFAAIDLAEAALLAALTAGQVPAQVTERLLAPWRKWSAGRS